MRPFRLAALFAAALAVAPGVAVAQFEPPPEAAAGPVDVQQTLAPYGDWLFVSDLGWVWHPSPEAVGPDFEPYSTNGQWVYSDYGWAWQSDYPWGWLTFHYGRWLYLPDEGWVWVPGDEWAPAWVDWRYGPDVIGWAPLGPEGFVSYVPGFGVPWVFVEDRFFVAHHPGRHRFHRERMERELARTRPVPRRRAGRAEVPVGPPRAAVARATGRPIPAVRVRPRPLPAEAARMPPPPPRAEQHP